MQRRLPFPDRPRLPSSGKQCWVSGLVRSRVPQGAGGVGTARAAGKASSRQASNTAASVAAAAADHTGATGRAISESETTSLKHAGVLARLEQKWEGQGGAAGRGVGLWAGLRSCSRFNEQSVSGRRATKAQMGTARRSCNPVWMAAS